MSLFLFSDSSENQLKRRAHNTTSETTQWTCQVVAIFCEDKCKQFSIVHTAWLLTPLAMLWFCLYKRSDFCTCSVFWLIQIIIIAWALSEKLRTFLIRHHSFFFLFSFLFLFCLSGKKNPVHITWPSTKNKQTNMADETFQQYMTSESPVTAQP